MKAACAHLRHLQPRHALTTLGQQPWSRRGVIGSIAVGLISQPQPGHALHTAPPANPRLPAAAVIAAAAPRGLSSSAGMSQDLAPRAKAVLDYWFGEGWEAAEPADPRFQRSKIWFMGGPEVDAEIIRLFAGDCEALIRGEYDGWVDQPQGALAGILIGDQLSRNAYRGTARMYAADDKVLGWAKALVAKGSDKQLTPIQRVWVYMPYMHSEALEDQQECVAQFERLAQDCTDSGYEKMAGMAKENIKYAAAHRDVVAQWGRFPHRNTILGRQSTPEEAAGIAAGTIPKW